VAAGFVLRVAAGCLAIPVRISEWIIFCTFTLALFIALCKRRAELLEMGEQSADTRRVLPLYTVPMLDTFISIAAGLTITAYSLYTFTASHKAVLGPMENSAPFPFLMTTIPFVVYGIFRYLLLAHSSPVGGEPEQMLRDRPLVLHCQGGSRSAIAASVLQAHGLTAVANLAGGFGEWASAGLPVEQAGAPAPAPA
jgi:rhodanese-related sulfurtransferase